MTRRAGLTLTTVVACGVLLRLWPWWIDPSIALRDDAAYHERLVRETVAAGRVPEVDSLSDPPRGRRLADVLPLGLYAAAAAFHGAIEPLDRAPVRTNLILFIALMGALTALPAYAATRALGGSTGGSLLAAAIIVALPAHIHRTLGHWVRYDALGVLLIVAHAAFTLRALRPAADRGRRLEALASAVFLVLAAAAWRVSLILVPLEAAWVLVALAVRGADPPLREWTLTIAVLGTAAFARIDPMRAQSFVRSPAWIAMLAVAGACWLPYATVRARARTRVVTVVIAALAAAAASRMFGVDVYGETLELLGLKLRQMVAGNVAAGPLVHLQLDVVELFGLSPAALLIGPQQFLALGPWFVAAPILFARRRGWTWRSVVRDLGTRAGLFAFWCGAFTLLTLLFSRNKVLLAPWVAVVCGLIGFELWRPPAVPEAAEARTRGRRVAPATPRGTVVLRLAFALCVLATVACGALLAESRRASADPALLQMTTHLREHTPPGAIVAAPWWYGYEVQALAERPALVDGLLESRENQRRILDLFAALVARQPDPLIRLCRERHVSYLLVPPANEFSNIAAVADPVMAGHIREGRRATPAELRTVLVRMMRGEPVPGFTIEIANERFMLLRVDEVARRVSPSG